MVQMTGLEHLRLHRQDVTSTIRHRKILIFIQMKIYCIYFIQVKDRIESVDLDGTVNLPDKPVTGEKPDRTRE